MMTVLAVVFVTGCPPQGEGDAAKKDAEPAPSADVNQATSHNALTEGEDQASTDRRMKARESLGFKSPPKSSSSNSSSTEDSN